MKKTAALALILCLLFSIVPMAQASTRLDLDRFSVVRYEENQAVYSGPGKDYLRANNGKALLGAGGECRLYGAVGTWMLVGYQLTNGDYRIGYVPKSAEYKVTRKGSIGSLTFDMTVRTVVNSCAMTDDPVINFGTIGTVEAGTNVSLLADLGEWVYIETTINGKITRGFVDGYAISASPVPTSYAAETPSYASGSLSGYVLPRYKTAKLGASYAIFTGPGEDYYRAQGIAYVGRTTDCRIYGYEGDWALVAYKTSSGPYRFGYVPAAVVPDGVQLNALNGTAVYCTIKNKTALTEDPVTKKGTLAELSSGTQVVFISYLDASMDWALVEAPYSSAGLVRGYVRANQLQFN